MNSLGRMPIDFSAINWDSIFSLSSLILSLLLIAVMLVLRGWLIRYVRKGGDIIDKDQRRWIIRIKNGSATIIIIGLIFIWAPQLHTFAISIAAFAVALVVALKEMILCFAGALMRATSQPFRVGEWVTVDGVTGEVIDLDAFAFHLQEVDMAGKSYRFTGRTISVPNAKLFTTNIVNANFFKNYIFEDVRIVVNFDKIDPAEAQKHLRNIVEKHFAEHRDAAKAFNRKIRRRAGVDIDTAEPSYDLNTTDLSHYIFNVRLFLPTPLASTIGAEITREFLAHIHAVRQEATQTAES